MPEIALELICQGERYRPIDEAKAEYLAQSMELQGLLQPIGVKLCRCATKQRQHYRLVFGAHRLWAAESLHWQSIGATVVLDDDIPGEMVQLAELQENNARNDLTGSQRKHYRSEIGKLLSTLREMSGNLSQTENWVVEYIQKSNMPRPTFYMWWQSFCKETGCEHTPKYATAAEQQAFFTWLDAEYQKAEADKKRREDEARERRIQQECEKAVRYLIDLIEDYGFETVQRRVWEVVYTQWEAAQV